ncbi:MAG: terminase family protein [Clostridia bacterium]|nr:terminase family protein [Clostridia bacterium]
MAKKELVLQGEPNEKQILFFLARAPHIAYGGAKGGGKSWAMRRKFVLLCSRYAGLRALLLRRTFPELEGNHIMPLRAELEGYAKYSVEKRMFTFPNKSILKLGYCDTEADVFQYQGQEYEVIGFEEATQFTEFQMKYIAACNRTTRTDFKPRVYYTCNPGGVGHDYIKRLFIDRRFQDGEEPDDYVFIPARVTDNTALMQADPQYIKNLKALPEHLRKGYLDGDWDIVDGQFFSEFQRSLHVVKPFPIPSEWRKFRAMDWGYNAPCCVLWFAVAPDRRVYVYREYYERQRLAKDVAKTVREMTLFEDISYTVASPDAWQQRGIGKVGMQGESIAETFMLNGVPLIPADNSRVIGWQRCHENLALAADGLPYVQIFSNCENLIRTLPLLTYGKISSNRHEDVSDTCEDHAPEAFRYGLMSRPSPAEIRPQNQAKILAFDPFAKPRDRAVPGGFFSI